MIDLVLVGIGTGNPEHLTLEALRELRACSMILIPLKGEEKAQLAQLRRTICDEFLDPSIRRVEFAMPVRDPAIADYRGRVDAWHDAIADRWLAAIDSQPDTPQRVGLLVWGDPSLYDSSLRIADRLGRRIDLQVRVVAGITSLQMLTAAHAIVANEVGKPFIVTTGRQLRDNGFPVGVDAAFVMLDGDSAFLTLPAEQFDIWWGAYLGMPNQIVVQGPLSRAAEEIVRLRERARQEHGWIMDTYLLRRLAGYRT